MKIQNPKSTFRNRNNRYRRFGLSSSLMSKISDDISFFSTGFYAGLNQLELDFSGTGLDSGLGFGLVPFGSSGIL